MRALACCILYLGLIFAQDGGNPPSLDSDSSVTTTTTPHSIESYLLDSLCALDSHCILDSENVIVVPKTIDFITRLGTELEEKTGFLLKVVVITDTKKAIKSALSDTQSALDSIDSLPPIESLDSQAAIALYAKILRDSMSNSQYAIIVFYVTDQKIDFVVGDREVFSQKLEERVYFEYMVPLLPKKDEMLTPERISAILFNGYSEAADLIAEHYGTQLTLNVPRDESGGREFVKISMYVLLILLFGVLGFVYISSKFFKK